MSSSTTCWTTNCWINCAGNATSARQQVHELRRRTPYPVWASINYGTGRNRFSTGLTAALGSFLVFPVGNHRIRELLPDPYLEGGGYHVMPPGGKFDVHADRNIACETGLARSLSLIIYLNKARQHEYGGTTRAMEPRRDPSGSCGRATVQPDGNFASWCLIVTVDVVAEAVTLFSQ
jgi:hypothetical protein